MVHRPQNLEALPQSRTSASTSIVGFSVIWVCALTSALASLSGLVLYLPFSWRAVYPAPQPVCATLHTRYPPAPLCLLPTLYRTRADCTTLHHTAFGTQRHSKDCLSPCVPSAYQPDDSPQLGLGGVGDFLVTFVDFGSANRLRTLANKNRGFFCGPSVYSCALFPQLRLRLSRDVV